MNHLVMLGLLTMTACRAPDYMAYELAEPIIPEPISDQDGDGVVDINDAFEDDPTEWADSDDDGVGDNTDNCVDTPNPDQIDQDSDGHGDLCDPDVDGDGFDAGPEDCDDTNPTINAEATEVWYDGVDQNCDKADDFDQDADGHPTPMGGGTDCDDTNPTINTSANEIWYDGVDQDCDKADDFDQDADGERSADYNGLDCDDTDPSSLYCGDNALSAGLSCDDLHRINPLLGDGPYWINPDPTGVGPAYEAWCDMSTDDGGWTRIVHLRSELNIQTIRMDRDFFTSAWTQNSTDWTATTNSNVLLDGSTYGMVDARPLVDTSAEFRFNCNDQTRALTASAIWRPTAPERTEWLDERADNDEYMKTAVSVMFTANGGPPQSQPVYPTHAENTYYANWHICGRGAGLRIGGFQLGLCATDQSTEDTNLTDISQIAIGYHPGYPGLRLECTADSGYTTPLITGDFAIFVR